MRKGAITRIRILLVFIVLAALGAYFLLGKSDSFAHYASGIMEREQIKLRATASEQIVEVLVEEGQLVEAGAVLLQLDSRRAELQLQAAKAARDEVESKLLKLRHGPLNSEIGQVRAQLAAANAALEEQKKNLDRVNSLTESGLRSESERDRAKSLWLQALSRKNELSARLRVLREGSRKEDIQGAEAALRKAEANLKLAQLALEDLTVTAPQQGWIEKLSFVVGSTPALGETLVILLNGTAPYARVYIPEEWHSLLRKDMEVSIQVDGVTEDLPGIVRFISEDPIFTPYFALNQNDRGHLSYPITIQIKDAIKDTMPSGTPVRLLLNQLRKKS